MGYIKLHKNEVCKFARYMLSLHLELEAASLHSVDITKLSAGYYTLVYRANGMEIREKFIKY